MILPFLMIDFIESNNQNTNMNIECIVFFMSVLSGIIKCTCMSLQQKKLSINIFAAIDDWLTCKNDKEVRKIMRKHARRNRILTYALLYAIFMCLCLSILNVMYKNAKQIFFTDLNSVNGKTRHCGIHY